ncbi:nucleolar MIF4G domain-containing protein 1 isoform X2 [Castor canadensis]|uniref:Nucleolar MIF4G domain-containing protein 1 isoform X2 n=1 Tax=Castor canadensis TaxID=51338 RepID=A0AC58LFZ7_CASCN
MAASASTGAARGGGCPGRQVRVKRSGGRRGPGGGGEGALKRLKVAVKVFVRATSEGEAPGDCAGRGGGARSRPGGRKSRKELRKEKRHLRKARRLQRTAGPGPESEEGSARPPPAAGAPKAKAPQATAEGPLAHVKAKAAAPRGTAQDPPPHITAKAQAPPGRTKPSAAAAAARKRALLAANQEEAREIRKLERCLGLNKRKKKDDGPTVPLSFARDGLDYILGALEPGRAGGLYDSSGEDEDQGQDQEEGQTLPERDPDSSGDEEQGAGQTLPERDLESGSELDREEDAGAGAQPRDEDVDPESREEAEGGARENRGRKRVRFAADEERRQSSSEGDDTKHQENTCESREKYVPPQVRQLEGTVDVHKQEELERLKKHVKGLINRLSEPNMASISGQLEELYMTHSRKDMNDTLTAALMGACVTASAMPSRLMMEHVLLVSILHHTVGIEVGACFLEAVVRKFDDVYKSGGEGKECDNLFTIVAHLYNFHVIRFMLETMLALKNNDMRKIPGYDPEPVEKLRKLQRALVRSAVSGSDTQLRVSWDGVLNADQTGRWWIVGSAWSGTPMIDNSHHALLQKPLAGMVSSKMLELARKQRMNTDIRRNIFCTIMMSEDFLDAFEKLLKLGLKDQQEREVVHVLVDCCLQEKTYNPFYAFLASKFCSYERRFQMTFQFSIWDKFRDLENLPATNFSNLVHLVAHLLKTKSLPLSILKVVEFSELDKPRVHFLRKVLTMLLVETEVEDLALIFARVSDNPKLGVLREGLKLFITHFLLKPTQAPQSAEQVSMLRERASLAAKALQGKTALRM